MHALEIINLTTFILIMLLLKIKYIIYAHFYLNLFYQINYLINLIKFIKYFLVI